MMTSGVTAEALLSAVWLLISHYAHERTHLRGRRFSFPNFIPKIEWLHFALHFSEISCEYKISCSQIHWRSSHWSDLLADSSSNPYRVWGRLILCSQKVLRGSRKAIEQSHQARNRCLGVGLEAHQKHPHLAVYLPHHVQQSLWRQALVMDVFLAFLPFHSCRDSNSNAW